MGQAKQLATKLVPIDSIKPYAKNAKIGDVDIIRESLRINGMYRPVVVWNKTKEILAGNHTWKAAKAEGFSEIWATFVQCDANTAKRINLVDNRAPELGSMDEGALVALLGSLPDLSGTGYNSEDMAKLLGDPSSAEGGPLDGPVPDDDYDSQFGVIVMCEDQKQQQEVFESLQALSMTKKEFAGTDLKVVAV